MSHRVFTDLDLHVGVPVRARPRIGEWGPQGVPTTRSKKVSRVVVPILFVVVAGAAVTLGYVVFRVIAQAVGL
jgi:hypothetical protein